MTERKRTASSNLSHMTLRDLKGVKAYLQRWLDAAEQAKGKNARAIALDPTDSSLEGYRYWRNVESGFKLIMHDITRAITMREGESCGDSGRCPGGSETMGQTAVEGTTGGNDAKADGKLVARGGRRKKPKQQ